MSTSELRQLSPLRNSTSASESNVLAREQATHFGLDPDSEYGAALVNLATHLYESKCGSPRLMEDYYGGSKRTR